MSENFFPRGTDHTLAATAEIELQHLRATLYDFVNLQPLNQRVGTAPKAAIYDQPDGQTCLYASLAGITAAISEHSIDLHTVSTAARARGLLDAQGARTFTEHWGAQEEFIKEWFGISARFIPAQTQRAVLGALTHGLVNEGNPVVFGMPFHWVALDGIQRKGENPDQTVWTGMDPAPSGRHIEIPLPAIFDRIQRAEMPLVVVKRMVPPAGFKPAHEAPSSAGFTPRA